MAGYSTNEIKIWQVQDNQVIKTLTAHTGSINMLKELNSSYFISCSSDNTSILWNTNTMTQVCTFTGHTSLVSAIETLNDGRIATGSFDGTIKIWNQDCSLSFTLPRISSTNKVYALKQLINWKLASAHSTGIAIWNLNTLQIDQNLTEHTNIVHRLEAMSSGVFISASYDGTIKFWSVYSTQSIYTLNLTNSFGFNSFCNCNASIPFATQIKVIANNTIFVYGTSNVPFTAVFINLTNYNVLNTFNLNFGYVNDIEELTNKNYVSFVHIDAIRIYDYKTYNITRHIKTLNLYTGTAPMRLLSLNITSNIFVILN